MKNAGCIVLLFLFLLFALAVPIGAAEYFYSTSENGEAAVRERWNALVESLPDEVKAELDGISLEDLDGAADVLSNKASLRYWLTLVLNAFAGSFSEILTKTAPLFSLMIFMAAVQTVLTSSASENLQKTFFTYTALVNALMLYRQTCCLMEHAKICLERMCNLMNLMTPVMEAVFLTTGSLTQKMVSIQAVTLFVTVAGNFTGRVLTPLVNLLFTLSSVASVCNEAKLSHLIGILRKLIQRLIQIFTIFFSFMLSAQSILAKGADSLGMRTVRFALGSFLPIAGSTIAEALSTLREGMALLQNAAGIGGILVLLLLILPDVLALAVYKFLLYFTGTAADLLKLDSFSALANEIHGIIELLMAIVLFTALMFVLTLILFTKAQGSI